MKKAWRFLLVFFGLYLLLIAGLWVSRIVTGCRWEVWNDGKLSEVFLTDYFTPEEKIYDKIERSDLTAEIHVYTRWRRRKVLDMQIMNGKKDGPFVSWYESGSIHEKLNYKNGKQDGLAIRNHPNGQPESMCTFRDGKPDGLSQGWHPNGTLKFRYTYQEGNLKGHVESWDCDGNLVMDDWIE